MLRDGAELNWIRQRVNLLTAKGTEEIARDIPEQIRARAFFSACVAEAHVIDRFRQISDDYSSGKIGRDEARNLMRLYARQSGKDDGTASLKNLASTSRLNLILDQNAKMARAVGEFERMYSPANLEAFPYVIYHASVGSKSPRSSHGQYDGMIFDKRDPWLRSHWPPWDFGCNCQLENCSAERAGRHAARIQAMSPPEVAAMNFSRSGFKFDPANAFEPSADLSTLNPVSRREIIKKAADAVRDGKLGNVGLIVAPPGAGEAPAALPGLSKVESGFRAMENAARAELASVGLDPDNLPDYKAVNDAFAKHGRQGKNIPDAVLEQFPSIPFEVAKLHSWMAAAAGLAEDTPVTLGRGTANEGIAHFWRNHKDVFVNPAAAARLLNETLGDPNCRIVVSLKLATARYYIARKIIKKPICIMRIVLHNPKTQAYCVMVYDGKELKLVSWDNADDAYGNGEWTLKP